MFYLPVLRSQRESVRPGQISPEKLHRNGEDLSGFTRGESVVKQKRVPGTEFVGKRSENLNLAVNIRGWGIDITGNSYPGRKKF